MQRPSCATVRITLALLLLAPSSSISLNARAGEFLSRVPNEQSRAAFDAYRKAFGPAREPTAGLVRNQCELQQITPCQGLRFWEDGPGDIGCDEAPSGETLESSERYLWVVRDEDVVFCLEGCEFGRALPTGLIKHTNLTGGTAAFCGGEMLLLEGGTVVVAGLSGRYPIRTAEEMLKLASSFKASGYTVWSMGFDDEAGRPFPFVGVMPVRI